LKISILRVFVMAAVIAVLALSAGDSVSADRSDTGINLNQDFAKAAAYCRKTGGVVQMRIAEYNTNGGVALVLGGEAPFCQYTASDGSNINLFLTTLVTARPTLATSAYYTPPQYNGQCEGNPASCYCSQLGGSDLFGGVNAAGGGWVLRSNSTDVLESCIMPDLSTIDSWGLLYHSQGIIRGIDLTTVLRYPGPPAKR
jgi:putative hemolysin